MIVRSRLAVRVVFGLFAFVFLPAGLFGQVSILTHHGDNARTGANLNESILNISNVNSRDFGKLATRYVDGNIYAQPLVATGVKARNRRGPTNLVVVATEQNNVYAFDADDVNPNSTGALVWKTGPNTLGPSVDVGTQNDDIKQGICTDLTPDIGITGTPVIQITNQGSPREGVVFLAAKSKTKTGYHYTLFALRLSDGSKVGSLEIGGEVAGRGAGSKDGKVRFDAMLELNRPGLLLVGNHLYVAFGGLCDKGDYHGWLFSYDVSKPKAMKQVGVLNTSPNGPDATMPKLMLEGGSGIWMSGEGPSADENGAVYFVTGNGPSNRATELGDAVVKAMPSGKELQAVDWFAPSHEAFLRQYDIDLGSTGVVLLPNSRLVLTGGKDGQMYLLDRDNLGKQPVAIIQVTQQLIPGVISYSINGTPAIWRRGDELFIYTSGVEDPVRQFRMIRDQEAGGWKFEPGAEQFSVSSVTAPSPYGPADRVNPYDREFPWSPGGFMSLTANGADPESGILWVTMPVTGSATSRTVTGQLRALDASDVSKPELWNSENTGNEGDKVGMFAKFVPPTVANGRVFVATFQRPSTADDEVATTGTGPLALPPDPRAALVIYGLRSSGLR